jgi:hypothetical protein
MKRFLIAVCFASWLILPRMSLGQALCRVTVEAQIDVAPGKLSLADLLSADTCPGLARAAAQVDLGSSPLTGSVRVLAGSEVRARLEQLAAGITGGVSGLQTVMMLVPERISIRRAGVRASCADISARLLASPGTLPWAAGAAAPTKSAFGLPIAGDFPSPMDCGAAGRIPQETPLQPTKTVWDPALGSWEVSARCVHAGDCVPFLVRVPGSNSASGNSAREPGNLLRQRTLASLSSRPAAPGSGAGKLIVRAGEAVTLVWDQDGIRLVVPAIALDAGAEGQPVRARIARGGRMLPAIVVSAGIVRAAS